MGTQSFLDQLWKSPIVMAFGAILGIVLVLAALAGLVWIEGKAISTAASLEQGAAVSVTISPDRVDPANDGKLVHLIGEATTNETLTDPDFGISVKALRLTREVEVYQWKETKTEKKKDGKTTVTYTYTQVWAKEKPPQKFAEPAGHTNPPDKPYADSKLKANDVKVGAFTLTPSQVEQIPPADNLPVTADLLAKLSDDLKGRAKADPDGLLFVAAQPGSTPEAPQVGDARIRYKVAKPQKVTVVAKQTGSTFEPYVPAGGEKVDLLKPGEHSAQTLFEAAQSSNRLVNWVLRVLCFVFLFVGVFLLIQRQLFVASGSTVESTSGVVGVAIFAGGVALSLMLFVIGIRWLTYQPGFGVGVLVASVIALAAGILGTRAGNPTFFASLFGQGKKWTPKEVEYFQRIARDPENAELRLAFAGMLEKSKDPLGEFIRIDQELEAIPEGDNRREPLDRRWSELLQAHGGTWFWPLKKLRLEPQIAGTFFPSLWMHHGIIDEVTIDLAGILPERADELFAAAPGLRVLEFHNIRTEPGIGGWTDTHYDPDVTAIVQLPHLKQIGGLKMSSLSLKIDDLKAIASSPNLENLTELDFSCNSVGPDGAVLVAKSPTLKRLRVLEMRSCDIAEKGAVALAGSANLAALVNLNLGANAIGPNGARALASSVHLKNLQTLALDDNKLGPGGAQVVAASPHLRKLTSLDLGRNEIGVEGAKALAGSPNLALVKTLKLNDNKLGGAGVRFLAASPHLGRLEVLNLETNEIDDEGAKGLAGSPVIKQLKELSLSYNNIGDAGLKALANWAGLARVTKLTLRQNKAGPEGIKALAASPYLRGLKELDVGNNEVGVAGARALAGSEVLGNLEHLWIQEAKLTSEGEQALRNRFKSVVHLT